jgi:hypothetical protein
MRKIKAKMLIFVYSVAVTGSVAGWTALTKGNWLFWGIAWAAGAGMPVWAMLGSLWMESRRANKRGARKGAISGTPDADK